MRRGLGMLVLAGRVVAAWVAYLAWPRGQIAALTG